MKRKNQSRFMIIVSAILSLAVIVTTGVVLLKNVGQKTGVDGSGMIKDDAYSIRNNATAYQKELYEALKDAMIEPVNTNEVAELVSKNFVADFYTWTNKYRLNDVGGLQFVYEPIRANVYQIAQKTTYADLYHYLNNGGVKDTLRVIDTIVLNTRTLRYFINDEKGTEERLDPITKKTVKGKTHEAIQVDLEWEYKDSFKLDTNLYESSATITLIKNEDNKLVIVEVAEYGD